MGLRSRRATAVGSFHARLCAMLSAYLGKSSSAGPWSRSVS